MSGPDGTERRAEADAPDADAPDALRVLVARTTEGLGDAVRQGGVLWDADDGAESPSDHYGAPWAAVALALRDADDDRWRALVDRWLARAPEERGHLPFTRLAFLLLGAALAESDSVSDADSGPARLDLTAAPARADDATRIERGRTASVLADRYTSNNWVLLARACRVLESGPRDVPAHLRAFTSACHDWLTEAGGFVDHPRAPARGRLTTPLAYHQKFTLLLTLLAAVHRDHAALGDGLGRALRWMAAFVDERAGSASAFGRSTESLFGTGCALVSMLAAWRGAAGADRAAWAGRIDALVTDLERRRRDDGLLPLNAHAGHGADAGWDPYMHLSVYNAWAAGLLSFALRFDVTAPAAATTDTTTPAFFHDPTAGLLALRGARATAFVSLQGQPVQDVAEDRVDLRTAAALPFHVGLGGEVAVPPPARLGLDELRRCPWMAGWVPVFAHGDELHGLVRLERVAVRGEGDGRLVVLGWGRPTRLHHVPPRRGSLSWWWENVDHHLLGDRARRRRGLSPPGLVGHHAVVALALDVERGWWGHSLVLLGRPADDRGVRPILLNPCGHACVDGPRRVPVGVHTSGDAPVRLTVDGGIPAARDGARGIAGDPVAWPLRDAAWTVVMGPGLPGTPGAPAAGDGSAEVSEALPMQVDLATATLRVPWGEVPMRPDA